MARRAPLPVCYLQSPRCDGPREQAWGGAWSTRDQPWQPGCDERRGRACICRPCCRRHRFDSGKSTLLDLLSARKTTGRLAPDSAILFNGRPPSAALLRRDVGYVEQHDTLLPLLTPAEMLLYTAELKQPRGTPVGEKQRVVAALVDRQAGAEGRRRGRERAAEGRGPPGCLGPAGRWGGGSRGTPADDRCPCITPAPCPKVCSHEAYHSGVAVTPMCDHSPPPRACRLSLEDCQHTAIGGALVRGISGGEAKRTNVGVSMINRPAVLLCDEPTSGLDSWNAHSVVSGGWAVTGVVSRQGGASGALRSEAAACTPAPASLWYCQPVVPPGSMTPTPPPAPCLPGAPAALRELALDGIAVCGTVHSTSPDTFALFDRMLVLQKGRVVYFGDNGGCAS